MKGQSGVEYLTTYGWAIFVLLIIIGVIVSSGVLTPNYLISEECTFGNNIKCNAAMTNSGTQTEINITLFNGFPYKVNIKNVSIETDDGSQTFSWVGPSTNFNISSGASFTFHGILNGPPVPATTAKRFNGVITYYSCAPELGGCSTVSHEITGRIVARIIPQ